jgi:RecB family endonuclease NucS
MAVRKLQIDDVAKLQALVVENFDAIEPGLTVLDARLLLGHATIDVIGVDTAGTLVLGAVGFSANEEMLLKAVEAYSWCLEYPESLVRLYPS